MPKMHDFLFQTRIILCLFIVKKISSRRSRTDILSFFPLNSACSASGEWLVKGQSWISLFIQIILLRTVGSPKAGKRNNPLVEMFGPSKRK